MAQDFERVLKTSIGTSATEVRAAANNDGGNETLTITGAAAGASAGFAVAMAIAL